MTALDIIVLALLGGGAVFGFRRGFVEETLSLIAWMAAVIVIRLFHAPVSEWLAEPVGTESGAAVLALIGLFAVTYFAGRWTAQSIGARTRRSALGPFDRVLGFGFGAIKGLIVATLGFLLVTMILSVIWPGEPEPEWIATSRTFPLLNASSNALVEFVDERRSQEAQ